MQVKMSTREELENTIKMVENGLAILRQHSNTDVTLKTLSVIAALVTHQEAKTRQAAHDREDEIINLLLML